MRLVLRRETTALPPLLQANMHMQQQQHEQQQTGDGDGGSMSGSRSPSLAQDQDLGPTTSSTLVPGACSVIDLMDADSSNVEHMEEEGMVQVRYRLLGWMGRMEKVLCKCTAVLSHRAFYMLALHPLI